MLPKINQFIKISLNDDEKVFPLKARVAEIKEDQIWIEIPINEQTGKLEKIPLNQPIFVFYHSNELGNITFPSRIIGIKEEQVRLLIIKAPDKTKIKRVQRRDYLRVSTSLEFALKTSDNEWSVVRTIDLSGGGMQITVPVSKRLKVNEKIEGWLVLPFKNGTIEHLYIVGEVVRIISQQERPDIVWIPIKFLEIKEANQPKIIRYCYERQMDSKNKGLN